MNTHDATAGELDPATQREHEAATRVKNIHKIVLGRWEMQTWYYSPFPKGYADCDTLYFCEFDLHFVKRREVEIIAECASPALQQRRVDASNSSSEKK